MLTGRPTRPHAQPLRDDVGQVREPFERVTDQYAAFDVPLEVVPERCRPRGGLPYLPAPGPARSAG